MSRHFLTRRKVFVIAVTCSLLVHTALLLLGFISSPVSVAASSEIGFTQPRFFDARRILTWDNENARKEVKASVGAPSIDRKTVSHLLKQTENLPQDSEATEPTASNKFFTVREVDEPALPFSDWIVPWDDLRKAKVKEFVVRLWILDTGEVLQADVLQTDPKNIDESVKNSLSSWLLRTKTSPALKNGSPVASQRTIEVTLEL